MNKFPWRYLLVGAVAVLASAGMISVIVIAVFGLEKEDPAGSALLVTGLLGMVYGQAFCINHGVKNQLKNKLGLAVAWYAGSPHGALLCGILVNLIIMLMCIWIPVWVFIRAVFGVTAEGLRPGGFLNPIWVRLTRW